MIEHVGVGDCSIRSFSTGPYQNAWDVSSERKNQGLGWADRLRMDGPDADGDDPLTAKDTQASSSFLLCFSSGGQSIGRLN